VGHKYDTRSPSPHEKSRRENGDFNDRSPLSSTELGTERFPDLDGLFEQFEQLIEMLAVDLPDLL
jgi:hypothetical protein